MVSLTNPIKARNKQAAKEEPCFPYAMYPPPNIQMTPTLTLRKIVDKSSQFLSSAQPYKPKNLEVALNIAKVEQIRSGNLWLRSS